MAADPYLIVRCGVCGFPWCDDAGKVIHPINLSCSQYLPPEPERSNLDPAIAVNMPGKYDPRQLRRNPADTHRDSPSFRIPRTEPNGEALAAIDVQPSMNGKHE